MSEPKLIINSETEFALGNDLITIGRAPDNSISLSSDTNVSRYHAEIECRGGDDFWVIDLGSFNGTTLNGEKFSGEKPLNDGDLLSFGGTSEIEVLFTPKEDPEEEAEEEQPEEESTPDTEAEDIAPPEEKSSGIPLLLIVAALAVGLAVILVVAAGLYYITREEPGCEAQARILRPERGDTIKETTKIEVDITNGECVDKVSYQIEGKEFANSSEPPFSASIEPTKFPEFADGLNRNLKIVMFDEKGIEITESNEVAFFIETIEVESTTEDPTETQVPPITVPNNPPIGQQDPPKGKEITARDSIKMSAQVVKQFSGNHGYKFNQRFLQEVRKRTTEYASEGYFERAQKYRDVINIEYIRESNLDPPLGYTLAMSRSKFLPKNNAEGTGLWKMSNEFVITNAYAAQCGTETIASASQKCAAKASSLYLKNLVLNVFEGDVVYAVAAFGMSLQEAEAWKSDLPANRIDFWNVIKSPKRRQEVINFFAAAIVTENPQKFGLENDRPLSDLYSVFMK